MNIEKVEIKPNQYVWVDKDAEINNNSYGIDKNNILCEYADDFLYMFDNAGIIKISITAESIKCREIKKIIAASPELNLEGVPLYVELLAEQEYPTASFGLSVECERERKAFIKGYQKAEKELFTEEEVREVFHVGRLYQGREGDTTLEEIIEQLKQEKTTSKSE